MKGSQTRSAKRLWFIWPSHDRPIHELIDPIRKDIHPTYEQEFVGMTAAPISYEALAAAREKLVAILRTELTDRERQFLLSVKQGQPKWDSLGIAGIEKLPALQWKLRNIQKMSQRKHIEYLEKLKAALRL